MNKFLDDLNRLGIAVFVKTTDGTYEAMNHAGAEALGMTASSVVGLNDFDLFDEQSARLMQERDARIRGSDEISNFQSVVRTHTQWMRFHSCKFGIGDTKRKLIGLSRRIDGAKDQGVEKLIFQSARIIQQSPEMFFQLIEDGHEAFKHRPTWRES